MCILLTRHPDRLYVSTPSQKVVSESIACNNCGETYNTNFLFCPNCSSNLTLPDKISKSDISYKDSIEDRYFERYQELQKAKTELDWIDAQKSKQDQLIKSLEVEENRLELDIKQLRDKVKREKKDVKELENMTWTSFKAKLLGRHSEKLQEEEEEYLEAVQTLETTEKELDNLKSRLRNARADMDKIEEAAEKRDQIESKITSLIYRATEGIKDEREDEIELEINQLSQNLDPYTIRKSKIQTALSFLQMAAEYIRNATLTIDQQDEKEMAKRNALLMEVLTKSEVSEVRQIVKEASTFLNQAYEIMYDDVEEAEEMNSEEISHGLFQGQGMWERFMKNFMRDMKKGFRSKDQTKEQLQRAYGDVNKVIAWINSLLNDINYKISELMEELRSKEQDLIRERRRIFNERYEADKVEDNN